MDIIDLSQGWDFRRRKTSRDWLSGAKAQSDGTVTLPHSWNAADVFLRGVVPYRGYGSYRKRFPVDRALDLDTHTWFLEAEGFYGIADVWLNGTCLGRVDGQYLGFRLPVDEALKPDQENVVAVLLTNRCPNQVLPGIQDPDFLLYGGMSGKVQLRKRPRLRISEQDTFVHTAKVNKREWDVVVDASILNGFDENRTACLQVTLSNAAGDPVASSRPMEVAVPAGGQSTTFQTTLRLHKPELWGVDSPTLYRMTCAISEDTEILDSQHVKIGIREAEFRPRSGFYLNGERVALRGCNRHESMPGFGNALPEKLHLEDAKSIKGMGLNFVRLSHYPQHPSFLEACDSLGIMAYAELASWKSVRTGRWLKAAARQWRAMMRRDRNHPSVIVWGMGNESRSRKAYECLRGIAREVDPTRPVTYAENHFRRAVRAKTIGVPDVWSVNYELEVMDRGFDASRLQAVLVSECSNHPEAERGDPAAEPAQVELLREELSRIEGNPAVSGFAMWCFNDYATLRKKRYRRYSGLVDGWRTPKMSAAYMQARYGREPFVKIFADWAEEDRGGTPEGERGGVRSVSVFSNCPRIAILRNMETVWEGPIQQMHRLDVSFEPGVLTAVGHGSHREVCDRIESFLAADSIRLSAETTLADAEGGQPVSVEIIVEDAKHRVVRNWCGFVSIKAEGEAIAHGLGDNHVVPVAGGMGRTFLSPIGMYGTARISAFAEGLSPGTASVLFQ